MISDFRNFAVEHGVDEILQKVWEVTGYMKELEFENTIDAMNRIENLKEFLTVTKEYEHKTFSNNEPVLQAALQDLMDFLKKSHF